MKRSYGDNISPDLQMKRFKSSSLTFDAADIKQKYTTREADLLEFIGKSIYSREKLKKFLPENAGDMKGSYYLQNCNFFRFEKMSTNEYELCNSLEYHKMAYSIRAAVLNPGHPDIERSLVNIRTTLEAMK